MVLLGGFSDPFHLWKTRP